MRIHRESLLRVPLVKSLFDYPLVARAVDHHWYYQKATPSTFSGFQPFSGCIYYGTQSYIANWLQAPHRSARDWNINDNLIKEVMFAVHDSLHLWAVGAIQTLRPDIGYGSQPINKKNFDDFLFCHLLTEAVAVCGLDYWYLSTVNLNTVLDIGTNFRTLTVNYHEEDKTEFQKFAPDFEVLRPGFLWDLTRFYCNGEFEGFSVEDLKRSPKLLTWLSHELRYGKNQRAYARDWFSYLSKEEKNLDKGDHEISVSESWKEDLSHQIADLLWQRVRNQKGKSYLPAPWSSHWKAPRGKKVDYRFLNLNSFNNELQPPSQEDFEFYFYQEMIRRDFASFPPDKTDRLEEIKRKKDFQAAQKFFRALPKVKVPKGKTFSKAKEPRDLFVLP